MDETNGLKYYTKLVELTEGAMDLGPVEAEAEAAPDAISLERVTAYALVEKLLGRDPLSPDYQAPELDEYDEVLARILLCHAHNTDPNATDDELDTALTKSTPTHIRILIHGEITQPIPANPTTELTPENIAFLTRIGLQPRVNS